MYSVVDSILSGSDPNFESGSGFVNKTALTDVLDYLSPRKDFKMKDNA